jgi:hypothetical protein
MRPQRRRRRRHWQPLRKRRDRARRVARLSRWQAATKTRALTRLRRTAGQWQWRLNRLVSPPPPALEPAQ